MRKPCNTISKYFKTTREYTAKCEEHGWSVASKTEKDRDAQVSFHEGRRSK